MEQTQKAVDLSNAMVVDLDQLESMCACNSSCDQSHS